VTWETCDLRAWLNGEFLQTAFSDAEQAAIVTTMVDNGSSQGYSGWNTDGGNDTPDKVFLLSYAEARHYYGVNWRTNNTGSRCPRTAYATARGASYDKNYGSSAAGQWWLRSPGSDQRYALLVYTDGSLGADSVRNEHHMVRPALWVGLDSGIF
jgi:hypothetical protein